MIGILNTGVSNSKSIFYALERIGIPYKMVDSADEMNSCDRFIIPGVGHFNQLNSNFSIELREAIKKTSMPVLGICLGMQFLFNYSEEDHKKVKGLNIIHDDIEKLPIKRLPHMGWNNLKILSKDPLLDSIDESMDFYFVHTYAALKTNDGIAKTEVEGISFNSIVKKNNFYGVQFHPEKSAKAGQKILSNFSELIC